MLRQIFVFFQGTITHCIGCLNFRNVLMVPLGPGQRAHGPKVDSGLWAAIPHPFLAGSCSKYLEMVVNSSANPLYSLFLLASECHILSSLPFTYPLAFACLSTPSPPFIFGSYPLQSKMILSPIPICCLIKHAIHYTYALSKFYKKEIVSQEFRVLDRNK